MSADFSESLKKASVIEHSLLFKPHFLVTLAIESSVSLDDVILCLLLTCSHLPFSRTFSGTGGYSPSLTCALVATLTPVHPGLGSLAALAPETLDHKLHPGDITLHQVWRVDNDVSHRHIPDTVVCHLHKPNRPVYSLAFTNCV